MRGQLNFPHLLQEGVFQPSNWTYTFIYPGVKTEYNYVAAIPSDVLYVRMQGDFEYLGTGGASHHAAKVLKVPNTALQLTSCELFPRVLFEVSVNFLGSKDEHVLVELIATLENKGVVPLKIGNFSFKLLGLKENDPWVRGGREMRGQLKFPHLLQEGVFVPSDWGSTFVYPDVKTEYNYVAAIPSDVLFVRMQGDFEYLDTGGATAHTAKVLKVPNTALQPTP